MINKQANILFIPTSIGGCDAEPQDTSGQSIYYQRLIYASLARSAYTIEGFQNLGRQLAAIASQAYLARQMNAVELASELMLALPVRTQLEEIARYYQALCKWRQGDVACARQSLERTVEKAPPQYQARALQVIGLTYQQNGDVDSALPLYIEAGRAAAACGDLLALAQAQEMIPIVRSVHGDHKQALADLEKHFPLISALGKYYPASYYDYLNSLAVELAAVGRIGEAKAACAVTLASPFAVAHPNWTETRDEIAAKRVTATPSVVAINRAPEQERLPEVKPQRRSPKAVVISLAVSDANYFQRSVFPIPATATFALGAISILDRVLICAGPRAPPACI